MQSWLEGRILVGKGAQATGMTANLRIRSKLSWFKHLGEFHKEWTEAGVSASRVTTLRRLQKKGYQATSEPETTSEASYLGCGEKITPCLWGIVKRKMRDTRPNNADDLKATVKETWASIPPQQCHKLITSMPRRIEAVIKAKGAPTKYWVHIQ